MSTPLPPRPARPPQRTAAAPAAPMAVPAWMEHPAAVHVAALLLGVLIPSLIVWLSGSARSHTGAFAPIVVMLGIACIIAGLLLYLWWVYTAWRSRERDTWMPHWMFGEGPSAISRHPGWLGVILVVLGQSLLAGGWAAWIYLVLLCIALDLWVRLYQEPIWERAHPDEYLPYRDRVARWLPWSLIANTLRDIGALIRNSIKSR